MKKNCLLHFLSDFPSSFISPWNILEKEIFVFFPLSHQKLVTIAFLFRPPSPSPFFFPVFRFRFLFSFSSLYLFLFTVVSNELTKKKKKKKKKRMKHREKIAHPHTPPNRTLLRFFFLSPLKFQRVPSGSIRHITKAIVLLLLSGLSFFFPLLFSSFLFFSFLFFSFLFFCVCVVFFLIFYLCWNHKMFFDVL
ncbi:uncharacterized protein PWA37_000568 [Arxiozyma heterogenica]|uniref:uncharacterized protein n=1 Tax=Arxiozyma heterogenica TaxID=278026 RepID=UPI002F1DA268